MSTTFPSVKIVARVSMLATEEGGRRIPFLTNYRPLLSVPGVASYTSLIVTRIVESDSVDPGTSADVEGWVLSPPVLDAPLAAGTVLTMSEGSKPIGSCVVLEVLGDRIPAEPGAD